jgi:hypothetical protein
MEQEVNIRGSFMKYWIVGKKDNVTLSERKENDILYVDVKWHSDTAVIINASGKDYITVKGAKNKNYSVKDCMGRIIGNGKIDADITEIAIPLSAQIFIND